MNHKIAPRALPPELRGQLRAEFEHGMDSRPRRTILVPLVAAAAAVVLLAGTVFVLRQMPDAQAPAADRAFDPVVAGINLDRCWNAVRAGGVAERFPDRSRWTPVFTVGDAQLGVVAVRADGRPFFCQTTPTTATVSDPAAAPDTGVAAVLSSREGVVAGVVDVAWDAPSLEGKGAYGSVAVVPVVGDGMFVALTGINPDGTAFTVGDGKADRSLAAPAPAAAVRDHPDGPAPDRTSEAGRMLGDCLSRSATPVLDPDSYQPAASVAYPGGTLLLGQTASMMAICQVDGPVVKTTVRPLLQGRAAVMPHVLVDVGGGRQVVGGEISETGGEVAAVEIGFDGSTPRPVALVDRTFAILVPPGIHLDPASSTVTVILRGADGVVLLENDWPFLR